MSNDPSYRVGYGRPPQHAKWKKGQSGNPKGRPPGAPGFSTILRAALDEKVTARVNGAERQISKLEAVTKQLVNKAAAGDPRPMQLLIDMLQRLERHHEPREPREPRRRITRTDREVVAALLARLAQTPKEEE